MGLVAVSLPDSQVMVFVNADGSCSETNPDILLKNKWIRIEKNKNTIGNSSFN